MTELNQIDVKNIKSLYKSKGRVFVDLKHNVAKVVSGNNIVGFVEKSPSAWNFQLTAPVWCRFKLLHTGPVIVLKGIFTSDTTCELPSDFPIKDLLNKRFRIEQGTMVQLTEKKNAFMLPNIMGIEITIPRFILERVANFTRSVDYEFIPA